MCFATEATQTDEEHHMQGRRGGRGLAGLSPERLNALAAAEARCAEKTAADVTAGCAERVCLMGCMLWMQCARKWVQQDGGWGECRGNTAA